MTIPVWVLLAFAGWTLVLLILTVGIHRWQRILTGRAQAADFRGDRLEGPDFYKRAMRAHANCIENLPVYAAIVVVLLVQGLDNTTLDALALTLMAARVIHTMIFVSVIQTNAITLLRFTFYFVQVVCMVWMGVLAATATS